MIRIISLLVIYSMVLFACEKSGNMSANALCAEKCKAKNSKTALECKLMPEELRIRKETVLQSLKSKVLERKELSDGYAFRFDGSDAVVDEIVEFIKTERECCDFFIFNLSISGDKSEAWLELTGVKGAKDFVTQELGL